MVSERSFETLMSEHHAEIYRYALRVTGRMPDAQDLSQETFLRAYRAYPTLPPDANARAWLFTIATNLARNHFRGESRRRQAYASVEAGAVHAETTGPQHLALSREASEVVQATVAALPLRQRVAFLQRKVHDLPYETIGESLGCSADTARAHVFQALRKIRRALDGLEAGPGGKESTP